MIFCSIDIGTASTRAIVPDVLAEDLETRWGDLTIVTGSYDRYAAMEAAGLDKDISVMPGTGTAWGIDGRTSEPVFDDERFWTHPGRYLRTDCHGLIVTLWQIGAGLDRLIKRFGLTQAAPAELEARIDGPRCVFKPDRDSVRDVLEKVCRLAGWQYHGL